MPYDTEEDRDPDKTQEQQEGTPEQIDTEEQDTTEALIKRGMGISAAPEKYQPAPPRYIRAEQNSEDGEDGQDEEEHLEALIWPLNLHYSQDQHKVRNQFQHS